jgi:hypothetical protein
MQVNDRSLLDYRSISLETGVASLENVSECRQGRWWGKQEWDRGHRRRQVGG